MSIIFSLNTSVQREALTVMTVVIRGRCLSLHARFARCACFTKGDSFSSSSSFFFPLLFLLFLLPSFFFFFLEVS